MSIFDVIAERKIQQAIDRGEFDRLPFRGIPIDIQEDFSMPITLRLLMVRAKSTSQSAPEDSPLARYWAARRYQQRPALSAWRRPFRSPHPPDAALF
ncbi:MAG: DUF1992 domain-containing protein [Betaproteobacteria bacterium]|nr:DUF1992 domain-containing protein [Betaproteobacteria bacterium]